MDVKTHESLCLILTYPSKMRTTIMKQSEIFSYLYRKWQNNMISVLRVAKINLVQPNQPQDSLRSYVTSITHRSFRWQKNKAAQNTTEQLVQQAFCLNVCCFQTADHIPLNTCLKLSLNKCQCSVVVCVSDQQCGNPGSNHPRYLTFSQWREVITVSRRA